MKGEKIVRGDLMVASGQVGYNKPYRAPIYITYGLVSLSSGIVEFEPARLAALCLSVHVGMRSYPVAPYVTWNIQCVARVWMCGKFVEEAIDNRKLI